MGKQTDEKSSAEQYDERLKGTFVTVIFIGVFIMLSWFGIFYYYITTF
ncbi:cytochrome c oxidase subunit 2A [Pseudogracilibacillus sp. SO30301A]